MLPLPHTVTITTPEECQCFGRAIALRSQIDDVIALCGPIGIGKTTLVKSIISGLGIREETRSQTFTIIERYGNEIPIYHVDLYRVSHADMYEIGLQQLCENNTIVMIEWADKITAYLPDSTIWIKFSLQPSGARVIHVNNKK